MMPSKTRSESDVSSGLALPLTMSTAFGDAELQEHYDRFKSFDLDDSGFISAENLKAILEALGVAHTEADVANMIEEVAILSGHENDGCLSFRDYIHCLEYESRREAVNEAIDAARERELSVGPAAPAEAPAEATGAAEVEALALEAAVPEAAETEAAIETETAVPDATEPEAATQAAEVEETPYRMRRSSFGALDALARGRIARFETVIQETVKEAAVDDATARRQARFAAKLAKFQQPAPSEAAAAVEDAYKRSVKDKLHAFEAANAGAASQVEFRKTWKKVGSSHWRQKTQVAGAPPPKRNIHELP